jgi:hypothetical protein
VLEAENGSKVQTRLDRAIAISRLAGRDTKVSVEARQKFPEHAVGISHGLNISQT